MSIFQKTIQPKIDFSTFPLNRFSLLTCNFGELVPCFVQEVLPNDRFKVRGASTIQFAPMVAPMMQDVYVSYHYFYIPDRILYADFESAFTGTRDGRALSEEEIPEMPGWTGSQLLSQVRLVSGSYITPAYMFRDYGIGTLSDFLEYSNNGAASGYSNIDYISDIPFRAYFKIWYDWYRDENLQYKSFSFDVFDDYYHAWNTWFNSVSSTKALGYCLCDINRPSEEITGGFRCVPQVKYRSYRKDYFTACLPSPQKGEPVTISLGTTAPVIGDLSASQTTLSGDSYLTLGLPTGLEVNQRNLFLGNNGTNSNFGKFGAGLDDQASAGAGAVTDVVSLTGQSLEAQQVSGLSVDLSQATAITINELRTAFALQRVLEAMSVSGSRYNEYLLSQYGTAPEDLRLQRPQFLGGWTQSVAVQQVIQTGGDQTGEGANFMNQPGYAAGRMYSAGGDFIFSQTFKEPGYIIGIMSVMPKSGYFQGMPKHLTRKHRFDYYNPHFAYLGEQAVKNKEIYFTGDPSKDEGTFGYMQRWAEYRTSYDTIHGDFKSSLKYMHMYREFNDVPVLGEDFILTKDVDTRPFVLWKEQTNVNKLIWAQVYHQVEASRPMPYNPMPGIHG